MTRGTPHIVILSDEPGWHGRRLREAFAERGATTTVSSATAFRWHQPRGVSVPAPTLSGVAEPVHGLFVRGVPGGTLEQVCLRMEFLHQCEAVGIPVLNPPRTIEITVNKAMTSMRLAAAGIPGPETFCGEDPLAAEQFVRGVLDSGGRVVVKPLFGSQGEGIRIIEHERDLPLMHGDEAVFYLQRFYGPAKAPFRDWRIFIIEGEVVAAMERRSDHWITNRAQGASCHPLGVTTELADLAERAASSCAAPYLGVDIIPGPDGLLMTEVNSIPAWQGLQRVTHYDIAGRLAQLTLDAVGQASGQLAGCLA